MYTKQVRSLLSEAKDIDALITALPLLTEPKLCISVLVTVEKWFFKKVCWLSFGVRVCGCAERPRR